MSEVTWASATGFRSGRDATVSSASAPVPPANSNSGIGMTSPGRLRSPGSTQTPTPVPALLAGLILLSCAVGVASTAATNPEPKLGPVLPENLRLIERCLDPKTVDWLHREHIRIFGWIDGGYTWSDTGDGLLSKATRPNRFGDEWLLNQCALVVERTLEPREWSWGFRTEFYCGADAALLRPLNGIGPDDNPRFGTDLRQLFLATHLPVLTDGGVDLKAGRIYVPIGYESTMAPYRPMYSAAYLWLYSQTGAATGGTATWHVTPQCDLIGGVTLGYNTWFELRGDEPSYIARAIYWLTPEKRTKTLATFYTGPQPIAAAKGHVPDWQTVIEAQVVHDWSRRLTTAFEFNVGWDNHGAPQDGVCEWYGGYVLGIVHLQRQWDLHLRAEGFGDVHGSRTGVATTYGEFSVGFNFMPKPWLNFRPEIRWDLAMDPVFGPSHRTDFERDQVTLAVDCLVKF